MAKQFKLTGKLEKELEKRTKEAGLISCSEYLTLYLWEAWGLEGKHE